MANYRIVRFHNRGRGIEATCDIPQGAIVVASPCVAISKGELHASLALYAFRYGDQAMKKAALGNMYAQYLWHLIQHDDQSDSRFESH